MSVCVRPQRRFCGCHTDYCCVSNEDRERSVSGLDEVGRTRKLAAAMHGNRVADARGKLIKEDEPSHGREVKFVCCTVNNVLRVRSGNDRQRAMASVVECAREERRMRGRIVCLWR
jgi:hypothetical protein